MRKTTIIEIFPILNRIVKSNEKLIDLIYEVNELKGEEENIFLYFCRYNGKIIRKNNLNHFMQISKFLANISEEERLKLLESISSILNDENIINSDYLNDIIENFEVLLDFDNIESFYFDNINSDNYYMSVIINGFIRILKTLDNVDDDKKYAHDLAEIMDSYHQVIKDLSNTNSSKKYVDENEIKVKRIQYFVNIVSDKSIYELDEDKFNAILKVSKATINIEELHRLKSLILFYRTSSVDEFIQLIDDSCTEFNDCSASRMLDELQKPNSNVKSYDLINKILNSKENT